MVRQRANGHPWVANRSLSAVFFLAVFGHNCPIYGHLHCLEGIYLPCLGIFCLALEISGFVWGNRK
jgi:hypothetical protein